MSSYCLKGKELLLGLKRSDWLPPYDDSGIRAVVNEIDEMHNLLDDVVNEYDDQEYPDSIKITVAYYHQCIRRNHRYLDRLVKLRRLRWEAGPVLPAGIHADTLSAREKEYFMSYSDILSEYCDNIGLDLTADLEPPKDLRIEIRVLQDCGEIMTESGPVSLDRGSIHFLRRAEVEQFIREGKVEHQITDDQC